MSRAKGAKLESENSNTLLVSTGSIKPINPWTKTFLCLPNALAPGLFIMFLNFSSSSWIGNLFFASTIAAVMGFGTISLSQMIKKEQKVQGIDSLLKEHNLSFSSGSLNKAIEDLKNTDRVLMRSFHIKESAEIEISTLRDEEGVSADEATHSIKQYLRWQDAGFIIEQEVIPNDETIWDLSANALVEVYGVKETKSIET
jgi:hypothetical protein